MDDKNILSYLILSARVVSNGLKSQEYLEKSLNTTTQTKALMTSDEAAQYMGVSLED
ncbi:hypothetical protein NYE80_25550 [Paenibacillus sp. FSL H7-0357]|uniref:hypothetical protein n=1 Tax=Paenibacillus sp. FSL H7-0357 TaxID=1536774 RepID=UPI0030CCD69A